MLNSTPKDSHLIERIVEVKQIYQGRIIRLEECTVALPNGKQAGREVIRHPGAVAVLAELSNGRVLCVRQYRTAPGEVLLEIPAGKLESGEDPMACARRELAEETGSEANQLRLIGSFYTSPGFADEQLHLFYAFGVEPGQAHPDEDEFVETVALTPEEVREAVMKGHVKDAKTWIGFQWWLLYKAGIVV